jgi:superfamily II DNA/RNA helicase
MQEMAEDAILHDNNILLIPNRIRKTLAFLLPILKLLQPEIQSVQCLILVPSRELGFKLSKFGKKWVLIIK